MSQKVLNTNEVHTSLYEPRRECMAEIVEAQVLDAGEFQCREHLDIGEAGNVQMWHIYDSLCKT
jgi:hypothetical protein